MAKQQQKELLSIHVNVQITPATLQAIVGHAKRLASETAKGTFHIDTADFVSAMISHFLDEKNFESYAHDEKNYPQPPVVDPDV
jgi:hypothetical protein